MPTCAFSMHPASVSASFKQGITMVRSIASVIPKIYLREDALASAVIGEYQRGCRKLIKEISRLGSPFPDGVEHHARMDSESGNARRASANDLPTGRKVNALRAARVVDNRFERAHKHGQQFGAAGLLSIPGAKFARYCRYRSS